VTAADPDRARLEAQLRFTGEAGLLKGVRRQTMLTRPERRRENSAEHSWHLAIMAMTLGEHAPPGTDIGRVIAMVLIHDLVEIDAGDLFLYASQPEHDRQAAAELAAADRIFALLPPDQAAAVRLLWDEFCERRSPEARFARALDRLHPMLENFEAGGGTWTEHGVTEAQVLPKVQLIEDGSPALGGYARELVRQAVAAGLLRAAAGPPDAGQRGAGPDP
jgi:putative hydrolases of HD superfamily